MKVKLSLIPLSVGFLSCFGSANVVLRQNLLSNDALHQALQPFVDITVSTDFPNMPETIYSAVLRAAINGNYDCKPSALRLYIDKIYSGLTDDEQYWFEYLDNIVGNWPYWFIIFDLITGHPPDTVFYPNNAQGLEYQKRFKKLQGFWDKHPPGPTLHPLSMHRIADPTFMISFLQGPYNLDEAEATSLLADVQAIFEAFPAIGPSFPLWTLNAFADEDFGYGTFISMGDGMTQFWEAVSLSDAGPDMVLFHEFGHLVQYVSDVVFEDPWTPENTRYVELMADALSGYYAHHPRGAAFKANRLMQVVAAAYDVGDCNFQSDNHHGTPNQRAKAVKFAIDLIDTSTKPRVILSSADFIARFDAVYNDMIAPDAQ